jgi:hypothetical protein
MCHLFSCVVLTVGEPVIRWGAPDLNAGESNNHSHEKVINALGLVDNGDGRFYRLECIAPFTAVRLDETDERAREWWKTHEAELTDKVMELATRVGGIYQTFKPKRDALYAEYQSKWDALDAEYQPKRDALDAEFTQTLSVIEGYVVTK